MGKRVGIALLLILLLNGCLSVRQIERNCDKFEKICFPEEKIIYRDSLIIIHDTIFFEVKQDPLIIRDTVRVNEYGGCSLPFRFYEKGYISIWAGVNNSVLSIDAWFRDSSILIPRQDTVLIHSPTTTKYQVKTVTPEWMWYYLISSILIFLIWFIIIIKKK